MKERMPDYDTTFSLAVETIKKHLPFTATPRGGYGLVENHGRKPSLGVAVDQVAQPRTASGSED